MYLRVSKAHLSNVVNGKVAGVKPVRSFRMARRLLIRREWIDEWLDLADHGAFRGVDDLRRAKYYRLRRRKEASKCVESVFREAACNRANMGRDRVWVAFCGRTASGDARKGSLPPFCKQSTTSGVAASARSWRQFGWNG